MSECLYIYIYIIPYNVANNKTKAIFQTLLVDLHGALENDTQKKENLVKFIN